MGCGNLKLRKIFKDETTYKDKNVSKHKCSFEIPCILKVIDKDNNISYYNVLKCNQCLSFKSISLNGNVQGCIFQKLTDEQIKLPFIEAYYKKHFAIAYFRDLENVSFHKSGKEIF